MKKVLFLTLFLFISCGKETDTREIERIIEIHDQDHITESDLEDLYSFYKSQCFHTYAKYTPEKAKIEKIDKCIDKNMKPYYDKYNNIKTEEENDQ